MVAPTVSWDSFALHLNYLILVNELINVIISQAIALSLDNTSHKLNTDSFSRQHCIFWPTCSLALSYSHKSPFSKFNWKQGSHVAILASHKITLVLAWSFSTEILDSSNSLGNSALFCLRFTFHHKQKDELWDAISDLENVHAEAALRLIGASHLTYPLEVNTHCSAAK